MKGLCPLASGSKGNSIYVGMGNAKLLVDAGLSAKSIVARLVEIGVDIEDIDAILVTHEHIDHIRGLQTLSSKYDIPIFANSDTARAIVSFAGTSAFRFKIFSTGEPFEYGGVEIHPFSVQHDAADPVAFTFSSDGVKVGVCADLGFATTLVQSRLTGCDYLYIEANHQPEMVHASARPAVYKQRVLSRQGHLSNEECAALLSNVAHHDLKHVYLAHLSSECNAPDLAVSIIRKMLESRGVTIPVTIAHQDRVSDKVLF